MTAAASLFDGCVDLRPEPGAYIGQRLVGADVWLAGCGLVALQLLKFCLVLFNLLLGLLQVAGVIAIEILLVVLLPGAMVLLPRLFVCLQVLVAMCAIIRAVYRRFGIFCCVVSWSRRLIWC